MTDPDNGNYHEVAPKLFDPAKVAALQFPDDPLAALALTKYAENLLPTAWSVFGEIAELVVGGQMGAWTVGYHYAHERRDDYRSPRGAR